MMSNCGEGRTLGLEQLFCKNFVPKLTDRIVLDAVLESNLI